MRSADIRASFRDFFATRDHAVVPSASLVPAAYDPSVLLTTAGMQPFKPYFLGLEAPPAPRVTSTQKCFRTTDIDEVGNTARHLTLFEMMGNFSFGAYFKAGAIPYAWSLSTEGWGLDPAKIWITVYEGDAAVPADEEAIELWLETGVPAERIVRLGEDNFWKAGPTGPCGPCSELFIDRGPEHGCGRPAGIGEGLCAPGCSCDRFLEFWNLVFMQYDRGADGSLTPLPKPSIDTGSGVERVSAILQDVHSVFETDGFQSIIGACEQWSGARYRDGGHAMRSLRVLADHGRAMTMLATDGVVPGNEGRGYILRRIIRRAVSHGHRIGLASPFLVRLQDVVIESFAGAYPELDRARGPVADLLGAEEEQFARTLDTGSTLLEEAIAATRAASATELPAATAFRLHDTYGFPIEVTRELVADAGLSLDEGAFAALMDEQRDRSRAARGGVDREQIAAFARGAGFTTEFVGYDDLDIETSADAVEPLGERLLVKLRRSPFYAEGGGQVADTGTIEWSGGRAAVVDVIRIETDQVIVVDDLDGRLEPGTPVRASVDGPRRRATMANHTATHLLHRALRDLLGEHVQQRGSAVRPDKLRFDFSHGAALTADELREVEDRVNDEIVTGRDVAIFETSQDEARRLGATMLFGEKYGDVVRVVDVVGYTKELCGGTHCRTSAEVGPFRILAESSVGQGVRRIEAVTARTALDLLRAHDRAASEAAREARVEPDALAETLRALRTRVRELERQSGGGTGLDLDALAATAERPNGVAVLTAAVEVASPDALLELADRLRGKLGPSIVVLGASAGDGVHLVAAATPEAVDAGYSAADAIGAAAPVVGGRGGGRPALARAGGKDAGRLDDALAAARALLVAR